MLPGGVLFKPLVADPRWPHFGAAYQYYLDGGQLTNAAAVSFGESFAFYRNRLGGWWWEIGLHAAVFSVFDIDSPSFDLVNADYMVGLPLTFRYEDFSAMLRFFHQSSHLGDEFLLRTQTNRINLSYESVDLLLSYEFGEVLRLYGGAGYLFHQTPSNLDALSAQYGVELRSPWPAREARWRPLAAVDVKHREENGWSADVSARAGIEIDGILATRKVQILLEYFSRPLAQRPVLHGQGGVHRSRDPLPLLRPSRGRIDCHGRPGPESLRRRLRARASRRGDPGDGSGLARGGRDGRRPRVRAPTPLSDPLLREDRGPRRPDRLQRRGEPRARSPSRSASTSAGWLASTRGASRTT